MEGREGSPHSKEGNVGGGSNNKIPFLDRSKVRILLCDNDAKSSDEVFSLLCKCSYQVTSVRTARQVIDALNAEGPDIDIILTEVDLPIAKGFKLLKYIMRDKGLRRIPIIMMSAQDEVSVVVKCLRLGAADYLVRPLRTNELLNLWTHMWRRRHMLGLAEKNILNYDFDLVGSDPSDANTNSTPMFSDDTDDKSRRIALPEMSVSNHQEDECNMDTGVEPPLNNSLECHPDVPLISDRRTGQIASYPQKSELKVGESSAFFTYVKSSIRANNSQRVSCVDENTLRLETSSIEEKLPQWCKRVSDDAPSCENTKAGESYTHGYDIPVSHNGPDSTSTERSCTPPVPWEFLQQRSSKEQQSTTLLHPSNGPQVDVSGVPTLAPLPYYFSSMMNQVTMPSSAQMYQQNLRDMPKHTTSSLLPQYNHHCPPRLPVMTSFPYYPVSICLQPGQIPATHVWPSGGSSSSTEVKAGRVEKREAALIKFRQKRKDRCFDKKIRYVNRKRLAEKRPRVRGQFVRQVSGVELDLSVQPVVVDDSDEDGEDDENEDELASRDYCREDDA
ncbi:two-component response regulator-like APRR1 [Macadamia integrifolia]|uniref:two-component response regulator-like APRR1 n=1 Tax=Macadamia integrifolia TaxID=60698 RepID=UPI001C4F64CC|nr:two-component response regulator-like APRR1 [Macadamia integrifolia]XP_042511216.1 two-component response regulator-like APRR1 [Macadamia integrifolia]XP_042511217.1 two-component response regulator-like APRR1 [Macadamia integrifolia]